MGKPSDIIVPAQIRREVLKQEIKSMVRRMATAAAAGQIELPKGMDGSEAVVAEYRARVALMDRLLNPPWLRNSKPNAQLLRDLKQVEDVDAALNRLVGQVAAKLETPRKPKKKAK
jgi:hypothetical protein